MKFKILGVGGEDGKDVPKVKYLRERTVGWAVTRHI